MALYKKSLENKLKNALIDSLNHTPSFPLFKITLLALHQRLHGSLNTIYDSFLMIFLHMKKYDKLLRVQRTKIGESIGATRNIQTKYWLGTDRTKDSIKKICTIIFNQIFKYCHPLFFLSRLQKIESEAGSPKCQQYIEKLSENKKYRE